MKFEDIKFGEEAETKETAPTVEAGQGPAGPAPEDAFEKAKVNEVTTKSVWEEADEEADSKYLNINDLTEKAYETNLIALNHTEGVETKNGDRDVLSLIFSVEVDVNGKPEIKKVSRPFFYDINDRETAARQIGWLKGILNKMGLKTTGMGPDQMIELVKANKGTKALLIVESKLGSDYKKETWKPIS